MNTEEIGIIKNAFDSIGQSQIFRFWKELNQQERNNLIEPLKVLTPGECQIAWEDMQKEKVCISSPSVPEVKIAQNPLCASLEPYRQIGEESIKNGKTAAFTVAGGQGTRLGHVGPKGTYNCTSLRRISLFEKFAESLRFFSKRYNRPPWWFIMTSEENHQETKDFFCQKNFFGLEEKKIKFFKQGMMPVFDLKGKILLKEKHQILLSPNGHGGSFRALHDSGALKIMENEGIDYISYFQVDNPMVYCLDPAFIGLHQMEKSEMSSKAVEKLSATEPVGTFVKIEDKLQVVEYSDIPNEISQEKNSDGSLRFNLGNIAIHLINRSFIQMLTKENKPTVDRLCYHGASKPVSYVDEKGNHHSSTSPNALKAETFVFDALPMAKNPLIMQVEREEEFAPIKNNKGFDSLESSQKLQNKRAQKWLRSVSRNTFSEQVEIASSFAPTWPHFVERMSNPEKDEENINSNPKIILKD